MIEDGMIKVSVAEFVSYANDFKTYASKEEWAGFWAHVKGVIGNEAMLQSLGECKDAAERKGVEL